MTAPRLILLLLLILVAVVLVVLVLRRGSAQRDAQRVEAAGLRTDADALATTVAGQEVFADQAAERAELARVEAEDKAREAARLEAEAAEHRAAAEATQRDYEATMRRADDIDPDVKKSEFPAVGDEEGSDEPEAAPAVAGSTDAAPADAGSEAAAATPEQDEVPMTRAERRAAREAGQAESAAGGAASSDTVDEGEAGSGWGAPSAASSAATAGAAGGAAAGASAWAARGDDEDNPQSERIASAADFRDDVAADPADAGAEQADDAPASEHDEVYPAGDAGTEADMSNDSRTDTAEHAPHDDGLEADGSAAEATAGAGGAYAATRALHEETAGERADRGDADNGADATDDSDTSQEPADDLSHDVESPRGEWGGPPQDEPAEMTIISEPEAYATDEPVMASDQTPPVSPDQEATDHEAPEAEAEPEATDHEATEAGATVDESDDGDRSAADVAEESTQERYDPTPTRDWAADEGELLEETHDRGDRLEAERADLAHEAEATTSDDATDATASDDETDATASGGRRISAFDELRDGGFGVGSAAPLEDGAQPLDHPVQAYRDTMTYRLPGDAGYDSAEPHVWFYDESAAERSGFRRSEG